MIGYCWVSGNRSSWSGVSCGEGWIMRYWVLRLLFQWSSTTTQSMFTGMQSLSAGLVYCSRWEWKIQIFCQEWSSCGRIVSRDMCWGGWLVNMSRRITVWLLMTDSRCWTHEGADTGTIKEKISVHGDSTSYQQSPSWEGHLDSQESYHGYRPDSGGGQRNMCQIIIFGLGSWSQFKW